MAADAKPFDYALYLMGELSAYLEDRADELSTNELASLLERLARIVLTLRAVKDKQTADVD